MWAFLSKPHPDLGALLLRVGLAAIFIFHGYHKVVLVVDGSTWTSDLSLTTQTVVAWGEFVAGLALLVGLLSRLAAVGSIVIQGGAIAMVTGARDFVSHDFTRKGFDFLRIGYEYNVAIIIMCLAVIVLGSGKFSLDHCLFRRRNAPAAAAVGPPRVDRPVPVEAGQGS